jgi:hypothetical protein
MIWTWQFWFVVANVAIFLAAIQFATRTIPLRAGAKGGQTGCPHKPVEPADRRGIAGFVHTSGQIAK